MKLLAAVFVMLATVNARQVSIIWDAAPVAEQVVGWRIYNSGTLISASNVPSATLTLPNDEAVLTVTAVNAAGESQPSAPLVIPPPMIWIQKSTDNVNWQNVIQIPYVQPSQFIRMEIPPP